MYTITTYTPIKVQFPLFLATVLTNKFVILTILVLQCGLEKKWPPVHLNCE